MDSRRQQPEPGADPAAGLGGASLGAAPAVLSAAVQGAGGGKRWSQVGRSKTRRPRAPRAEPGLLEPEPPHAASGKPATVPAESSRSSREQPLLPKPPPDFSAQRGRKVSDSGDRVADSPSVGNCQVTRAGPAAPVTPSLTLPFVCVPVAPWILRRRRYRCGSAKRKSWCPASPAAPPAQTWYGCFWRTAAGDDADSGEASAGGRRRTPPVRWSSPSPRTKTTRMTTT